MSAPTPPQAPPGYISLSVRRESALATILEITAEILTLCKPLIKAAIEEALSHKRKPQ